MDVIQIQQALLEIQQVVRLYELQVIVWMIVTIVSFGVGVGTLIWYDFNISKLPVILSWMVFIGLAVFKTTSDIGPLSEHKYYTEIQQLYNQNKQTVHENKDLQLLFADTERHIESMSSYKIIDVGQIRLKKYQPDQD